MLDKSSAIPEVMRRVQKMDSGISLQLLTWKRDRSLILMKNRDGRIRVEERGFQKNDYLVEYRKLKKLLKRLLKREFPRSHKIRLNYLDGPSGQDK